MSTIIKTINETTRVVAVLRNSTDFSAKQIGKYKAPTKASVYKRQRRITIFGFKTMWWRNEAVLKCGLAPMAYYMYHENVEKVLQLN